MGPSADPARQDFHAAVGREGERTGRSRNQDRFALVHRNRCAAVVGERAAALDADRHDERVERREVECLGAGQIVERRGEIGARHQFHARVLRRLVMGPLDRLVLAS